MPIISPFVLRRTPQLVPTVLLFQRHDSHENRIHVQGHFLIKTCSVPWLRKMRLNIKSWFLRPWCDDVSSLRKVLGADESGGFHCFFKEVNLFPTLSGASVASPNSVSCVWRWSWFFKVSEGWIQFVSIPMFVAFSPKKNENRTIFWDWTRFSPAFCGPGFVHFPRFFGDRTSPIEFFRSDNCSCPISKKIELKCPISKNYGGRRPISKKRGKNGGKGCQNQQRLWSDPCGARLAPGLKLLRLPRAQCLEEIPCRALGGLVFNLPDPRVNKTHHIIEFKKISSELGWL